MASKKAAARPKAPLTGIQTMMQSAIQAKRRGVALAKVPRSQGFKVGIRKNMRSDQEDPRCPQPQRVRPPTDAGGHVWEPRSPSTPSANDLRDYQYQASRSPKEMEVEDMTPERPRRADRAGLLERSAGREGDMSIQESGKAAPDTTTMMAGSDVLDSTGSVDPWTGSQLAPATASKRASGVNLTYSLTPQLDSGMDEEEQASIMARLQASEVTSAEPRARRKVHAVPSGKKKEDSPGIEDLVAFGSSDTRNVDPHMWSPVHAVAVASRHAVTVAGNGNTQPPKPRKGFLQRNKSAGFEKALAAGDEPQAGMLASARSVQSAREEYQPGLGFAPLPYAAFSDKSLRAREGQHVPPTLKTPQSARPATAPSTPQRVRREPAGQMSEVIQDYSVPACARTWDPAERAPREGSRLLSPRRRATSVEAAVHPGAYRAIPESARRLRKPPPGTTQQRSESEEPRAAGLKLPLEVELPIRARVQSKREPQVHEYVKTDAYPDQNGNADSLYFPYDSGPGKKRTGPLPITQGPDRTNYFGNPDCFRFSRTPNPKRSSPVQMGEDPAHGIPSGFTFKGSELTLSPQRSHRNLYIGSNSAGVTAALAVNPTSENNSFSTSRLAGAADPGKSTAHGAARPRVTPFNRWQSSPAIQQCFQWNS